MKKFITRHNQQVNQRRESRHMHRRQRMTTILWKNSYRNSKDVLVIEGDWNAKVGPDAYEQWPGTVGRFGVGEPNEKGERFLEFAHMHKRTMVNTISFLTRSKDEQRGVRPCVTHNQIDCSFTPRQFTSSINRAKSRTFPEASTVTTTCS